MNKLTMAASAAAFLAAIATANAEEATGTIAEVDPNAGTLTLTDGQTYVLLPSIDAASLRAGDMVTIEYEVGADGQMMVREITPQG